MQLPKPLLTPFKALARHVARRQPDRCIGTNYLQRWYVIPRNPILNIYLHRFLGDDPGRSPHDHPWWSVSVAICGTMHERTFTQGGKIRRIEAGMVILRTPRHAHQLFVASSNPYPMTLFVTGPRIRNWGFWTPRGWVPHNEKNR